MLVVTSRASVMQNSTCSTTATTATSRPSGPRASPTVTPSRAIRLATGQAPAAEAASSPTASGRVRSGYSASVAGSRVPSRPNAKIGRISQPSANTVKMTVVRSTDALRPRNRARTAKAADRDHEGKERADDERGLRRGGRAQRVEQQPQLQLDEEPSHDSPSSSLARGPTRSMNACCRVLPPRTCAVVPVATILPLSMMDT